MPLGNPLEILLAHDRWATHQLLKACETLSPEQFHRRFEMGRGSLHDSIAHMIAAMRAWTDVLALRPPRPRVDSDGIQRTVSELTALLDESADELSRLALGHPVDEIVSRERDGKTYTFTRGGVAAHATTHDMHHRAQCLNMLRQLGAVPLPPSSVLDWMLLADKPKV